MTQRNATPKKKSRSFPVIILSALAAMCLLFIATQENCGASQVRARRTSGGAKEIRLGPGGDLQAAVKSATFGDTIILQAGATYRGPLILLDKGTSSGSDADYITIRTSDLSGIAREGNRITPAHAAAMAKIVSPSKQSAIGTQPQAQHYKFIGIEFAPAADADYVYNIIDLGASDYTSASQFPHHIVFDRCYVHSTGLNKARRGFALNSAETSVVNSYVSGFAGDGDETQAVAGWNGPGPFHIINNYLEGGAEVLLFGGADPSIANLVPSDIEIRRNYFHKPAEWEGRATVKGTVELKNSRRVIIDGNLLESGIRVTAFVITVRNQDTKAPWSTIEDVQITNNIVRHASTGINILGRDNYAPSQEAKRLKIANNLFEDVDSSGEIAYFLQINGTDSVTVEHNTVQQGGNIITSYGAAARNFVFRNNIVQFNLYGVACSVEPSTCPDVPFCNCFPGGTIKGNVIADNKNFSASYPIEKGFPGNFITRSYDVVGFVDYVRGNWQLAAGSKYRGKGSDGKDPGVDVAALNASGVKTAKEGLTTVTK
ncbi:MAG: hypothetical protein M3Y84_09265 [Acidobacteriota bacterium]|nr:hypothetical protein [Acidobacteriota bacterium]